MLRLCALLAVLTSVPALASSQGDWFASLYTGDGVELRNDERVFALFAVFNALGFDQGPVTRKEPIQKVVYHPVRQLVRGRVIGGDEAVRKAADAFFDAHPVSMGRYLSYAIHGGAPPFAAGAKAKELADLKGFEQVLARAWTGWKLEDLMGQVQADYRTALKAYLTVVDGPLTAARAALKTPESTEVLLVVNLLDEQGAVRAVRGEKGEIFLIVGPADKPNVEGLIREFARLSLEAQVAKSATKWAGGPTVLREAQLAGAPETSVAEYATALLTQAVALQAMKAPEGAWETAANNGYYGLKDLAQKLNEGKAVDTWLLEALAKVETRRPVKK